MKSFPQIAHVEGLFDIIGKTVDNVTYGPAQQGKGDLIVISFTDGTDLTIENTEYRSVKRADLAQR